MNRFTALALACLVHVLCSAACTMPHNCVIVNRSESAVLVKYRPGLYFSGNGLRIVLVTKPLVIEAGNYKKTGAYVAVDENHVSQEANEILAVVLPSHSSLMVGKWPPENVPRRDVSLAYPEIRTIGEPRVYKGIDLLGAFEKRGRQLSVIVIE